MDISAVSGVVSGLAQEQTAMAVSMQVLKKAIDIKAASTLQLLQTVAPASNPPNLGNAVDIKV